MARGRTPPHEMDKTEPLKECSEKARQFNWVTTAPVPMPEPRLRNSICLCTHVWLARIDCVYKTAGIQDAAHLQACSAVQISHGTQRQNVAEKRTNICWIRTRWWSFPAVYLTFVYFMCCLDSVSGLFGHHLWRSWVSLTVELSHGEGLLYISLYLWQVL